MPNRRASIVMTAEEQRTFLEEGYTLQVASNGPRGAPHLAAMWYVMQEGLITFTTFTKSQKIVNLRRDPRITCMLEAGRTYGELRGLVVEGEAEVISDDAEATLAVMRAAMTKYPSTSLHGDEEARRRIAAKRSLVRVRPHRVYSWDHRKLEGLY